VERRNGTGPGARKSMPLPPSTQFH
jgi:hypothetical protein